jgi:hypothetical protein
LDWSNVFAAGKLIYLNLCFFFEKKKIKISFFMWIGGAVLNCLLPIPEKYARAYEIREWYHQIAYKDSDIDLFIWGLDEEAAKQKMVEIYETIRNAVPWEVACFRSKHCVTIVSQYPNRHIQV